MTQPVQQRFHGVSESAYSDTDKDDRSLVYGQAKESDVRIHVLIFEVNECFLAIDADQVVSLSIPPQDQAGDAEIAIDRAAVQKAAERLEFALGEKVGRLRKPRLLTYRSVQGDDLLMIEEPVRFMKIELQDIHAMPSIINVVRGTKFLWGLFFTDNRPVFLLDLIKMEREHDVPVVR